MRTLFLILTTAIFFGSGCSSNTSEPELKDLNKPALPQPTFQGEQAATDLAERMFEAIGGMKRWAELKSLYVHAEHTEPQMSKPYDSKIWRAIDHFEMRIEQGNDSFHVMAHVDTSGGTVTYLDHRDTTRFLTPEQLAGWQYESDHNVYVVLSRLAKAPQEFKAVLEDTDRLTFYEGDHRLAAFRLDEQMRPHLFYHPTPEDSLIPSEFSKWGTDNGYVHSAGGGPLDGNFQYTTISWVPSYESFGKTYDLEKMPVKANPKLHGTPVPDSIAQ